MNEQKKQAISFFEEKGFNIFALKPIQSISVHLKSSFPKNVIDKQISIGIIGSGGKKLWSKLNHPLFLEDDPIDMYSQKSMLEFQRTYLLNDPNFKIFYPNEKHTLPLQKISREFNLSHQSPNGLDISKDFGLWFSIRGIFTCTILAWDHIPKLFENPCLKCDEKPCLNTSEPRKHCPYQKEQCYDDEQVNYHAKALFKI